ncbi:signal transduction histidine-protein kinaseBarA [Striga asiatica]|uniref:Signal transduction histidine-protein kinaseBarA n=1 Tax=Striga asiatica TaxID=4170 RepID=A0A5A7RL60_STRAF|nr:signal transduction histidine-protein kinaseBarA [Striga asiatica]
MVDKSRTPEEEFTKTVCRKLGFASRWHLEQPVGTKGGLLVMWDLDSEVRQIIRNEFCIQMEVKGAGIRDCWVIAEDWNDITCNEEKRGGVRRHESSFKGFNSFIENMEMQEVAQSGAFFTWVNNRAADGEGNHDVVQSGWQMAVAGSLMYQVQQKIKSTRMTLLAWHKPVHRNSEKVVKVLNDQLENMRIEGQDRDWELWSNLKAELDCAHKEEEEYWRVKSRTLWLKQGDCDSPFFHAYTSQRRKNNTI